MVATLVDLAAVKAHCRVTDTNEDATIATYRLTAISWVENYTGHIVAAREVVDAFSAWGDFLTLRHQPITVDDPTPTLVVMYDDEFGDVSEYEDRIIRDQTYPWTLYPPFGESFPALGDNGTITVTYTAGYEAGAVPDEMNQSILILCSAMHANRGSIPADSADTCRFLLRAYRGAVLA